MEHVDLVGQMLGWLGIRPDRVLGRADHMAAGMAGLWQAACAFPNARAEWFRTLARTRIRRAIVDQIREVHATRRRVPEPSTMESVGPRENGQLGWPDVADPAARDPAVIAAERLDLIMLLDRLTPRERRLVRRRYWRGLLLRDCVAGVTESRACQMLRQALETMREDRSERWER